MKNVLILFGLVAAVTVIAQDRTALRYARTINADDLEAHLSILASDEFGGRETGEEGQRMAAQYIADQFAEFGLAPGVGDSYFQYFDLTSSSLAQNYFRRGNDRMEGFEDFIYYSRAETSGEEYINVVFAGDNDEMSEKYDGAYVVYKTAQLGGLNSRMEVAAEAGALGYIVIITNDDEFGSILGRYGPYLRQAQMGLEMRDETSDKMIIGGNELLAWLFEKEVDDIEAGETIEIIFNADYLDRPIQSSNVLGFLEGSEYPDEIIIITSHYDHIGITDGEINNGADDDGSGTSSVLEIAQAFADAADSRNRPKRSILFMTVSGEEKGLLGSEYYADYDPAYPLANTITNLNIDMVGRIDPNHEDNENYVYLIGSDKLSQELHDLSEEMRETYAPDMEFDYTYNDENDPNRFYYRSDHYNFAKNDIPIIFYFNGTHADYHQPSDTVDKIRFDILENRVRVIFHTAWEIANRDERITADKIN